MHPLGRSGTKERMSSSQLPPTFGRYEVVRRLGRGAVGEVYLARDPALSREVAIKTLSGLQGLPPSEQEESRARFLREARAAAKLSHPNIVTIFDVGEHEGLPYIAMEYLRGTTLDRYTKQGHLLPAAKVLEIGIQAALALDEAHRAGIIHRDVKPANMVLMEDGSLKMADFGLAKDIRTSLTAADTLLGTPNYMSPEQVAGKALDGRSDLFSLGISLFELLAGRRPFGGDTVSTVLYRIVNDAPLSISELSPDLPPGLEALLSRTLSKNPDERPATGYDLARELRVALEEMGGVPPDLVIPAPAERSGGGSTGGPSVSARREAEGASPSKSRRGRLRWIWALVILLVLVGGGWTLPLWGAVDPLGAHRRGVEDWLSLKLGGLGDAIRLTPREKVIAVVTSPANLAVAVRSEGATLDGEHLLHVPGSRTEPVVLEVDDPCYEGRLSLDPLNLPPTAVVEAAERSVDFDVVSEPAGAVVKVDGASAAGSTPMRLNLPLCKSHEMVFETRGRPPKELTLAADATAEQWREELARVEIPQAPGGSLRVSPSSRYPVDVLDARRGRKLGRAGQEIKLRPGRHRLLLVSPKVFYRKQITVTIRSGERETMTVAYPALGELSVISVPRDAKVTLIPASGGRGREVGSTPLSSISLAPGKYRVEVVHPASGKVFEQTVKVSAGGPQVQVRASKGRGGW